MESARTTGAERHHALDAEPAAARSRLGSVAATAAALLAAVAGCGKGSDEAAHSGTDGSAAVVFEGGGGVNPPPNGAALCPDAGCNYQTQEGCSAGQACRPSRTADGGLEPNCQDAGGALTGEPCEDWTECAPGGFCVFEANADAGVCRRLCCGGDWTVCPEGESCFRRLVVNLEGSPVQTGADLCFPVGNCDVLDEEACAAEAGKSCRIVDSRGSAACTEASTRGLNESCDRTHPCAAGFICVDDLIDAGEHWFCRRLCRAVPGGEPSCPPEEGDCIHYSRHPEGVGECVVL